MDTLKLPAKFDHLDEIREFVGDVARQGGFSPKDVYAVQLAADEAASNIIEHAYEGVTGGELEISCRLNGDSIVITLHDDGKPFDPSQVRDPNLGADLAERQIGGLGVYLMRKLMDEVRYHSESGTGNLLTMKKRRG
jgi:serine/threonine-protein kinase RsbW